MNKPLLPLDNLAERHPGLTPALAEAYVEAARICLNRHHDPPQEFKLRKGEDESGAVVNWLPPDKRCQLAWANIDDATRDGAYACAIAATELYMGMYAVKRAETLTGADYYIAPANRRADDLEDCLRLEVSGTNMDAYEVNRRLRIKVNQAEHGESSLPAIAVVVGFKVRLIAIQFATEE